MLSSMINSHPDLKCLGERRWSFRYSLKDGEGYNIKYFKVRGKTDKEGYLDFEDFKPVHLMRRSLLNLALSGLLKKDFNLPSHNLSSNRKELLGMYTLTAKHKNSLREKELREKHGGKISPSRLNPRRVRQRMVVLGNKVLKFADVFREPPLDLFYEDICGEGEAHELHEDIGQEICDYLGVDYHPMSTPMKKTISSYQDTVVNYDELVKRTKDLSERHVKALDQLVEERTSHPKKAKE